MWKKYFNPKFVDVQPWTPLEVYLNEFCFMNYCTLYATVEVGVATLNPAIPWKFKLPWAIPTSSGSGPRYFFPYPFLDLEFFYLVFCFSLWKFIKIYYFFKMRLRGESNPRPLVMSHTTKPLDQRGMSCQKADFNPWLPLRNKSIILLYTHIIERYSWLWIQYAINNERCLWPWGYYVAPIRVCGTEKYIASGPLYIFP